MTHGTNAELPIKERVLRAATEVQRSLLFSTAIMVCAFLPLFTMEGPAGQIFRPMAHTYAFALGGALLLAITLSPVLCEMMLSNVKPKPDNRFVRWMTTTYAKQLKLALKFRFVSLGLFAVVLAVTVIMLPFLGREFMPQLEEGNIYVRGTFPLNASLAEVNQRTLVARETFKAYPEVESVVAQIGRPDDGTDPTGFYNVEFYVPMKPSEDWPVIPELGRRRTKDEITTAMNDKLNRELIGVSWNFSQYIRDGVMEAMSGVKGENSVKIIGPDLKELEAKADQVIERLSKIPGVTDAGVFRIMGQSNLSFPIDRAKTAMWGVQIDDVQDVLRTAVGGKAVTQVVEGERTFDLVLRWPERLRNSRERFGNPSRCGPERVEQPRGASVPATTVTGASSGPNPLGANIDMPSLTGSNRDAAFSYAGRNPRRRLGDLVTPLDDDGDLDDEAGSFVQPGASTIYREEGQRLIALKFSVEGRDLGSTVAEAQAAIAPLIEAPFHVEWSGEFEQMEEAERRLMLVVPLSFGLVVIMLYLAFLSVHDVAIVLANVSTLICGGVLGLLLVGMSFSVSAAVGFISIFGVAIMNGLILVSSIHRLRLRGLSLEDAVMEGGPPTAYVLC